MNAPRLLPTAAAIASRSATSPAAASWAWLRRAPPRRRPAAVARRRSGPRGGSRRRRAEARHAGRRSFLEIRPDNSVRLLSPFVEGGQGINTGLAQTIGEELDLDPKQFAVECAPPGRTYAVVNGLRMTGGLLHPLQLRGHAPTGRHRPRDAAARCRRATLAGAAGLAHHRGRACNPPRLRSCARLR